jgi:3-hydroxyacyl-CoA dehydrogenase / enoyl-CoA hydratase / 3-hydroxybutyryl-CoA epimerase
VVADPDLADAGVIFGTGFAPFTGGPLHYAAALDMPAGAPDQPVHEGDILPAQ